MGPWSPTRPGSERRRSGDRDGYRRLECQTAHRRRGGCQHLCGAARRWNVRRLGLVARRLDDRIPTGTSDAHQIFTVRVSDGVSTRVTNEPQGAVDPSWPPDGGSIVFSTPNPSVNHYSALSVDLTTGQTRQIVPDGSTPELSPDGAWIALNSWLKAPQIRLILANSDGSGRRVIARFNGDDGYQEWSSDSTQIAFVADIDENGLGDARLRSCYRRDALRDGRDDRDLDRQRSHPRQLKCRDMPEARSRRDRASASSGQPLPSR
jgi:WD40-like Beta Propeller Repeat